jgi:hypothetical protein
MFSDLDCIIFPDSCEVIKVASQHYVYPIFKNGSSSLKRSIVEKNWEVISADNIKQIKHPITVFLRDPKERFISGVNTYLQHLQNNTELDTKTILFFVNEYLFLNRHYAPQFFWLLNLARYIDPNTSVYFSDFKNISELTAKHSKAGIDPITDIVAECVNQFDWQKLGLYFFLDQQLIDRIGQTVTIADLLLEIKNAQPDLYNQVFSKTIDLTNVLPKT